MKIFRISVFIGALLLIACQSGERKITLKGPKESVTLPVPVPIDKGFSQYISGFTSGVIPSNSAIEIHLTPEFAAKASKTTTGLFEFDPPVRGKTEWKDDETLVFTPSKFLSPGKVYKGKLNLGRIATVEERLNEFPLLVRTLKKDFKIKAGSLECSSAEGNSYILNGQIVASDFIEPAEVERYVEAKLGRKKLDLEWDHSAELIHKFTVKGIDRTSEEQKLTLVWNGSFAGVGQKGSTVITVPAKGDFRVIDVIASPGENQKTDVVFSDPVDATQELTGLVRFAQISETVVTANSNIVTILPSVRLEGAVTLSIESSLKNSSGTSLNSTFQKDIDFTPVYPAIALEGDGVILPSSENLIFPFKAANLKAVDLKIVKIFENNLPYFLQQGEINTSYSVKRFGRPVYSGKIDLINGQGGSNGSWNLYTVDLADYINIEPGVLYKVSLSMRKSYSTYPCTTTEADDSKYEEMLNQMEALNQEAWDDPENYYDEPYDAAYYSLDFDWEDRDNPCKNAYYNPDRRVSRNVLASNLGIIAKKGDDNVLHVMVNDLISAMPVSETDIDVLDYQMQLICSGKTNQDGSVALPCERKPFLVIAKKDKDRNYLKTTDGATLSLSSFDVSGNRPEDGIKAFIYGERDVWRPGDSIFLSMFIKDMKSTLPSGHPVQFELINPKEQKVDNQVLKAEGNLLVFKTKTSADAITGDYKAVFKIGGATFSKRVRIETVKPNRLKINLDFKNEVLGKSQAETGKLTARWLNGNIAGNMQSKVEYILRHSGTKFEKYGQYNFDDPVKKFSSESVTFFEGETDENGEATVSFDPGSELDAPGMLNAIFTARVMEPGGDESIVQKSYRFSPYQVYAGINIPALTGKSRMIFTDADNEVKIVTVSPEGKPVNSQVEINIYKVSYRWWWESDNEDLGYYISNELYKPVITKSIVTKGGEGSFKFRINKNEWGRYLIRVTTPEGHTTGKLLLVDWPWEYGMKANTEGATLLIINTDKDKYNPGDEISLSFPSSENARAIITLENSTGVIEEMRVPAQNGNTVVKFKARPEMAPNVYAYVSVIQPHAQTVNDMPVRLYGVVPIMVEDPATRLNPVIEMADEVRSQKPFVVKVRESNKKPMTYTLAVVDEGLLDITGYKTPDPWNYFFAREALGVQTWDLYDYVLGAYGGTIERLLAVGGDEALTDKSANKAQRFIPVVRFLGPFTLEPGKTASHAITLSQYTGSVRVMVIAGNDRSYGLAEKSVFVRDPLMVLVTAPRVVSPGDKVALPVSLFVQKADIKDVMLKAEGNELVSFSESGKNVKIASAGETDTEFNFTVGGKTGIAKITVTASGAGETASYNMELDVRSPNPPETRSELKILKKGEKWEKEFDLFGIEGSNSANIEVSSLPSINLEKRMEYLLNYPHGCSEQITSIVFPQLFIKEIRKNDKAAIESSSKNIKQAINMLVSRQMASGGIALWPGAYEPDNWVTSYAGHFMLEAEKMGYSIPSSFKQKWISYQKKTAREWRDDPRFRYTKNSQAYRLFTLSLAGQPDKGAMNRLRESKDIPQLSRWLLAASYALNGRPETATELLDMRITTTEPEYQDYYYGSEVRDKSIILYTLTILKNEEQALPLLKEICDNFSNDYWYSTQSLSWGLLAYMKWVEMIPDEKNKPSNIRITLNGEGKDHNIAAKEILKNELSVKNVNNRLIVENTADRPVYVTLTRKGIPLLSEFSGDSKGLSMKVEYYNMSLGPVDQKNLVQGTDFIMVVSVTNENFSHVDNLALTQMVPSGWEIRNTRLYEGDYGIKESSFDYRDFRDDRVFTYFSLSRGETRTFAVALNAAYTGEYSQPSVWCEAMYTPNCYARTPGNKVKVTIPH